MTTLPAGLEFHHFNFEHASEAAGFVAALSRFLNSPRGDVYMVQPGRIQLWSRPAAGSSDVVDVYLSDGALAAANAGFAPLPISEPRGSETLPSGCAFIFGGKQIPAWGLEDAERHLSPAGSSQEPLRARLETDLRTAMKSGQRIMVNVLRTVIAAIDNAGAIEPRGSMKPVVGRSGDVPRRVLSEEQMREVLHAEAEERCLAIDEYERLGRHQEAVRLREELDLLTHYLAT